MELRERKLCTLEGVVFSSRAIQSSPRPSSTQRRILAACGFSATLLFSKSPSPLPRKTPGYILVYMCYFRQLLAYEKFGSFRVERLALTDDAGGHPQDEQASRAPGDGAYPHVEDE